MSLRAQGFAATIGIAILTAALGVVAAHDSGGPRPGSRAAEAVSDTGHAERGGQAHLDPLALKPAHECLVCWLGQVGLGLVPVAAVAAEPAATAGLQATPRPPLPGFDGSARARAPPLA